MTYFQWIGMFWGIPIMSFIFLAPEIFLKYKHIFFKILVGVIAFGLISDIIAVNTGLWTFPTGVSGIYFLSLPIEEYFWTGMYAIIPTFLTLYFLERQKK